MQNTLACVSSGLVTLLLLFVGFLAATSEVNYKSQQLTGEMVPLPKITMAREQGPWPKCLGMSGEDCAHYIEAYAEEVDTEIIPEGTGVTMDFRTDRVRIFVDVDGLVSLVPSRG